MSSTARPAKLPVLSASRWKTSRTVRPAYALTSAVVVPHPADSFTVTAGLPTESVMVPSLHSHSRVGLVPSEFWISIQAWSKETVSIWYFIAHDSRTGGVAAVRSIGGEKRSWLELAG